MSIQPTKFRIIPDPQIEGKWAFHDLEVNHIVGGYASPKTARKGYEREKRSRS